MKQNLCFFKEAIVTCKTRNVFFLEKYLHSMAQLTIITIYLPVNDTVKNSSLLQSSYFSLERTGDREACEKRGSSNET